jgi:hypothetical protein
MPPFDEIAPFIRNERSISLKGMMEPQASWSEPIDKLKHPFVIAHRQNERLSRVPNDRYGISNRGKSKDFLENYFCRLE